MSEVSIVTGIFLIALTFCVTYLIAIGKMKNFRISKSEVSVESGSGAGNASETSLLVLDQMLEEAETNHKRRMLAGAYDCFKSNDHGRRSAVYLAALNHCIRDVSAIGLDNYITDKQRLGGWSQDETKCFIKTMLYSCIKLITARLEAYERVKTLNSSELFQSILKSKIDKNSKYLEQFQEYVNVEAMKEAMGSSLIKH